MAVAVNPGHAQQYGNPLQDLAAGIGAVGGIYDIIKKSKENDLLDNKVLQEQMAMQAQRAALDQNSKLSSDRQQLMIEQNGNKPLTPDARPLSSAEMDLLANIKNTNLANTKTQSEIDEKNAGTEKTKYTTAKILPSEARMAAAKAGLAEQELMQGSTPEFREKVGAGVKAAINPTGDSQLAQAKKGINGIESIFGEMGVVGRPDGTQVDITRLSPKELATVLNGYTEQDKATLAAKIAQYSSGGGVVREGMFAHYLPSSKSGELRSLMQEYVNRPVGTNEGELLAKMVEQLKAGHAFLANTRDKIVDSMADADAKLYPKQADNIRLLYAPAKISQYAATQYKDGNPNDFSDSFRKSTQPTYSLFSPGGITDAINSLTGKNQAVAAPDPHAAAIDLAKQLQQQAIKNRGMITPRQ